MLSIQDIYVDIEEKAIIQWVSLDIHPGKNYCILGKNGSGKSSLALSVMWHPNYEVRQWDILVDSESILEMDPSERAQLGVFLAFQKIPEIKWVKLFEFLRTIYNSRWDKKESFVSFKRLILPYLEELEIDKEFLRREVNVGFSGWERRKVEILQLKLLQPRYIFLDEVDSWLDVDAFRSVAELLQGFDTKDNTFVIITHYFTILEYIPVDHVAIMRDGKIIKEWDQELVEQVKTWWFKEIV